MPESWFTEYADELARCLADARECAERCEALLVAVAADHDVRAHVHHAVIAPAAVARVLIDLFDQPRTLVVAAARLCRDTAEEGATQLELLDSHPEAGAARAALRTCAASCAALVD